VRQHSLRYDVNCSILFTELPLLQRPAAAKAAGFDAVELWWPFARAVPSGAAVEEFASAVESAGVALVGLNFFGGDLPAGDRGILSWPARAREFRDSVDVAVAIGARLGITVFNALYGKRLPGENPQAQDAAAVEALSYAAAAASKAGAAVVLEPLSGAPGYPLLTAADAAAVIARVSGEGGGDNLRLLADLYHLSVNGDDIADVIKVFAPLIGHVQIADAPGRGAPGTGEIPLDQHLAELEAAGYRGRVGLEYLAASTGTARAFDWLPRSQRGG
jgi:hydroxypyruvate isomerase